MPAGGCRSSRSSPVRYPGGEQAPHRHPVSRSVPDTTPRGSDDTIMREGVGAGITFLPEPRPTERLSRRERAVPLESEAN